MPSITVNQLNLFYSENNIGGNPLLFIHGWLGSSLEWIHQLCYFKTRQHIIIIDLPGYGKSDKPKTTYCVEFFTRHLVEFLKLLGYNEVILIGHSLGGMIALNIAIRNPKLVKKLILISTSATFSQSIKNKFKLFWINIVFRLIYKNFLKNIIKKIISTKKENREFKRHYNNALKLPKSVVLSTFKNMTSKINLNKNLSQIFQPTLIIYGNEDNIISKSMINNLDDSIIFSELSIIENSAHRVMVENHVKVNNAIYNFIKR